MLSNDVSKIEVGGAQYSCLCREDGGILDDLFTYRLGDDRYLTVTNASNRDTDFAWIAEHASGFDAEVRDVGDEYAMLAVQGPNARELVSGLADGELPERMRVAELDVAGVATLVCGTGYTGEDGVELLLGADAAPGVWDALVDGGATPAGLGARDTLRLEVCFHLYGNDMDADRNPIEAGLGWCCKEDTGFIGSEAIARAREAGPEERLVPFVVTERGIPRQGNPVMRRRRARRRGDERDPVALDGNRHRHGLRSLRPRRARHRARDRRTRQAPRGPRGIQAPVPKGRLMADETYPDELRYHPEHDWVRIEGDTGTFGITWYAQDALGEIVFYDPPEVGAEIKKDDPYTEVESVKAVSDVYAPMSGEVTEVNETVAESPETINSDPYGDGWLVKVKLADPSEADALMSAEEYRKLLEESD